MESLLVPAHFAWQFANKGLGCKRWESSKELERLRKCGADLENVYNTNHRGKKSWNRGEWRDNLGRGWRKMSVSKTLFGNGMYPGGSSSWTRQLEFAGDFQSAFCGSPFLILTRWSKLFEGCWWQPWSVRWTIAAPPHLEPWSSSSQLPNEFARFQPWNSCDVKCEEEERDTRKLGYAAL